MNVSAVLLGALVGLGANLDIMDAGPANGDAAHRRAPLFYTIMAVMSGIASFTGDRSAERINHFIPIVAARHLGSGVLVAIGIWITLHALRSDRLSRNAAPLTFHTRMLVGLSQTLANLTVGFGIGFLHLRICYTIGSAALACAVFWLNPLHVVTHWHTRVSRHAGLIAGILLVVAGLIV